MSKTEVIRIAVLSKLLERDGFEATIKKIRELREDMRRLQQELRRGGND